MIVVCLALTAGGARAQQACQPLPSGILGWWTGDGTANDLTLSGNNGQLIGGATFGPGVIGNAFLLDGVNDRVDIADVPLLRPQRFTLAAWIRLDAANAGCCIICKQFGTSDANSYSLWILGGILRGGMFRFAEAVGTTALPLNQVMHTAVTYDGSIIRLYLDGKLIATADGPVSAIQYDTSQVILGADDNGTNLFQGFLPGILDEAQIFGRALSDCEIRQLYAARPQGSCKGDVDADTIPDFQDNCPAVSNAGQIDTDTDGAGDACDCAPGDAGTLTSPGDRNDLGFVSSEGLDWCRDPSSTGSGTIYDVIRGDLSSLPVTTAGSTCRSRCLPPVTGLLGWWPGDGSTTDIVAAHNGTLENGAGYGVGWIRDAFALDGVNDRVHTTNVTTGNNFSVATWVNSATVNQGAYHRIAENLFSSDYFLGTDGTGAAYKLIVKNAAAPYGVANGGAIAPGRWQFVAGTYDGSVGRLFVDGKQVGSDTFTAPGTVTLPLYLGGASSGGANWKGRIDETQLIGRTLSPAEITAIYEAGPAGQCKASLGGIDGTWTAPWAADSAIPAPGHGFWYLYRGHNACGVGSYGFRTGGAERISTVCD